LTCVRVHMVWWGWSVCCGYESIHSSTAHVALVRTRCRPSLTIWQHRKTTQDIHSAQMAQWRFDAFSRSRFALHLLVRMGLINTAKSAVRWLRLWQLTRESRCKRKNTLKGKEWEQVWVKTHLPLSLTTEKRLARLPACYIYLLPACMFFIFPEYIFHLKIQSFFRC
jgi:hypothetical protein